MTLQAISKSPSFFQPCESRAIGSHDDFERTRRLLAYYQYKLTPEIIDKLRDTYPEILTQCDLSTTILGRAVQSQSEALIEHIVQIGGKELLNFGDYWCGRTPLFYASNCNISALKYLVDNGAKVNTIAQESRLCLNKITILECFMLNGGTIGSQRQNVKFLLSRSACIQDPSPLNNKQLESLRAIYSEFSEDVSRVCAKEKEAFPTLTTVGLPSDLHNIVMDYAIEETETVAHDYIKREVQSKKRAQQSS